MMMIGRCSKGQHHIAVLVLAPDERTNEQNASFLRWEKNVGVLALLIRVLVRTKERKVFVYLSGGKREEIQDLERYFPWGKEGDYKEISLSLSLEYYR